MKLTDEQLEQIASYLEENSEKLCSNNNLIHLRPYDLQIFERITRVEEELRNQRELIIKQNETMQFGFSQIDKRFDDVNKRFEDVNKRFDDVNKRFDDVNKRFAMLTWIFGIGFTIIATVISLSSFFAK
ncbi:MAG TPA: hypothetical protein PK624_11930 [Spirochaetota bacterium]|nr:hypothetical protein [Spirochaetota bacterium]HOR45491.1 hypothetical protein [Spirochaetota bacterium]HPK57158.1 hypothetical protein [Spirochaetota bacterium]